MITESLLIGLILGFMYFEYFDLSPGGVITPGYCALFINKPEKILMTIVIALIIWLILEYLTSVFILYGRRRFLLALLLGILIKLSLETFVMPIQNLPFDLMSVGYIIPGLIANEMVKQKPVKTISSLVIVTSAVYLVMLIIYGPVY